MYAKYRVRFLTFVEPVQGALRRIASLSYQICCALSLVLASQLVTANPHFESPLPKRQEDVEETSKLKPDTIENLSITPVKAFQSELNQKIDKRTYYYPFKKELELHLGTVYGIQDSSDDEDDLNFLLGFSFVLPKLLSPKYVVGADLSTVGHGHVYIMRRHIYFEKGSFRPYYNYGLMHKFVPSEKGASLSNWENYLARVGLGFADIRSPPRSVQLDLTLAVGAEDILLLFTYGNSWGF